MSGKLLKGLGIALIALPDPTFITDLLGLLLVGSSFILSQRGRHDSPNQLKESIKRYMASIKDGEPMDYQPIHHVLLRNLEYSLTSNVTNSQRYGKQAIVTDPIIHHVLDYQRLLDRYKDVGKFETMPEKMVHHTLNRRASSQSINTVFGHNAQYVNCIPNSDKLVHHTLARRAFLDHSEATSLINDVENNIEKVVHHMMNVRAISCVSANYRLTAKASKCV